MPMGPLSPTSWSGSTAPVPGTSCRFGYEPWARWNEPPHTDICHGGLPSTTSLEGNWRSCLVLIRVFVPTWRDWERELCWWELINELQDGTQIVLWMEPPSQNGAHEAGSSSYWWAAPCSRASALESEQSIHMTACQQQWLWLLLLKSPPAQPQDWLVGFSSLSWLFFSFPWIFVLSFTVFRFGMCSLIPMIPQVSFLNICICWTIAYFFKSPPTHPSLKLKDTFGSCALFTKQKEKKKKRQKNIVKGKKNNLIYFGLIFGISFKVFFCAVNVFCQRPWCVSVCLSYRKYLKCKHGCFVMPPSTRTAAAFRWV